MESADLNSLKSELDDIDKRIADVKSKQESYSISYFKPSIESHKGISWNSSDPQMLEYTNILKELEAERSKKTAYYNRAKYIQERASLESVENNADFKEYSDKGASIANPTFSEAEGIATIGGGLWGDNDKDGTHLFGKPVGNIVTFSRDNAAAITMGGSGMVGDYRYSYMEDREVNIYNYYLGKGEKENAAKYLKSLEKTLNERVAGENFSAMKGNTPLEIAFGIGAGLDQARSGFSGLINTIQGVDEYIPASVTQNTSQMIRNDLADDGFKILGNSLGQVAYDTITSTSNMLPSILVSTVASTFLTPAVGGAIGSALFGASSTGNAYNEAINCGYTKDQARAYSTLIGAAEAGLQYILGGIGSLGKGGDGLFGGVTKSLLKNIDNALARAAIKLGGNILSEGAEEYIQDILDPWFKNMVFMEDNEIKLLSADALYSGLLGALSAGFLEGGNTASEEKNTYKKGKNVKSNTDALNRLIRLGKTYSADSVAYKIASKVNEKTGAYTIGRLLNEVGAELTSQNQADIVKSLERKGIDSESAHKISKWLAKAVEGETFTPLQINALETNEDISKTFYDVIINQNSTVNQRTAKVSEISKIATEKKSKTSSDGKTTETKHPMTEEEFWARMENIASSKGVSALKSTSQESKVDSEKEPISSTYSKAAGAENDTGTNGKAILNESNGTSRVVDLKRINSNENGEMTFELDTGEIVNAKDISHATSDEAVAYRYINRLGASVDAGNSIISIMKSNNVSGTVAVNDAMLAYSYGLSNQRSRLSDLTSIDESTKTALFGIGRSEAKTIAAKHQAEVNKRADKRNKSGKVHYVNDIDRSKLNDKQKSTIEAAEFLSKASSMDIYVYESYIRDGKTYINIDGVERESDANGWYIEGTDKIYIDINSGNDHSGMGLFVLAHESGHHIRYWNSEKWLIMADAIVEEIDNQAKADPSKPTFEQLHADKYKKYAANRTREEKLIKEGKLNPKNANYAGKTDAQLYDMAYEDVVCDSLASLMTDKETFVQFANKIKQTDRTLWQKIKDFIKDFISKLDSVLKSFEGVDAETASGRAIQNATKEVRDRIRELYVDAFTGANENVNLAMDNSLKADSATETAENVADKEETTPAGQLLEDYSGTVDNILSVSDETAKDFANKRVAIEVLKNTPTVILDNVEDARDLKVIINYNKLYLAVRKNGVFNGHYHNLGADIAKKLPEFLSAPDAIIQLANGRLNLFATVKTEKGNNGIVSVELNSTKDIGGKNEDYNVVVTMFSSNDNYVQNLISGDDVTEKYKREDLSQVNPQLYKWLATINDKSSSDNIISQDNDIVNSSIRNDVENNAKNSERDNGYTYNALVSKPDMKITTLGGTVPNNRADVIALAKKNAIKVGKFNSKDGSVSVHVNDIDTDVVLSTNGLKHGLDRRFSENALATLSAGEILKNAIRINELTPNKAEANISYVLIGVATDTNGKMYITRFVVNRFSNEITSMDVLYAINAKKENPMRSMRPGIQPPLRVPQSVYQICLNMSIGIFRIFCLKTF